MPFQLPAPRTSTAAVASLVLGLLSLVLLLLTAVPALIVGWLALRAINESDGRLRGRPLAIAGMVLGFLGGILTAAGFGLIILLRVNAYRDRVECADHLRSIGQAVNAYCDNHKDTYPKGTFGSARLAPTQRLSWMAAILPYLDQGNTGNRPWESLANRLDPGKPWDDPANRADQARLRTFLCRAAPAADISVPPGLTTYVGLAGIDPDAASLPKTDPRAGFFGYDRTITRTDLVAGSSYTLMVVETGRENGPWAAGGPATVRGVAPDESHYLGPDRPFGGLHPGGANVLWADGRVMFLTEAVPPGDFRSQAALVGRSKEDRP
jgi:prepilin-type processing-associated H-X9-DG protein